MRTIQSEHREYLEFWVKLFHKAQETQYDSAKRSPEKQRRINSDVQAITVFSLLISYFTHCRLNC